MAIHDCGFTGVEPLDSYSKAIKLAEQQPTVLCRLAKVSTAHSHGRLNVFGDARF